MDPKWMQKTIKNRSKMRTISLLSLTRSSLLSLTRNWMILEGGDAQHGNSLWSYALNKEMRANQPSCVFFWKLFLCCSPPPPRTPPPNSFQEATPSTTSIALRALPVIRRVAFFSESSSFVVLPRSCIYLHMAPYTCVRLYVHIRMYVCVRAYACVRVHVHMRRYVCVRTCACVYVRAGIHAHAYVRACVCVRANTRVILAQAMRHGLQQLRSHI